MTAPSSKHTTKHAHARTHTNTHTNTCTHPLFLSSVRRVHVRISEMGCPKRAADGLERSTPQTLHTGQNTIFCVTVSVCLCLCVSVCVCVYVCAFCCCALPSFLPPHPFSPHPLTTPSHHTHSPHTHSHTLTRARSYTLECNYNTGRQVNTMPPCLVDGARVETYPVTSAVPSVSAGAAQPRERCCTISPRRWSCPFKYRKTDGYRQIKRHKHTRGARDRQTDGQAEIQTHTHTHTGSKTSPSNRLHIHTPSVTAVHARGVG